MCNEFHGAGKLRNDFMNRERVSMVILLVQQLEVIIEVSRFRNICVYIHIMQPIMFCIYIYTHIHTEFVALLRVLNEIHLPKQKALEAEKESPLF